MSEYNIYGDYKSIEITQATATSLVEYDVSAAQSGSPTLLRRAEKVTLRTDQTVTIRFNDNTNDPITVTSAGLVIENLIVQKVFVTNASGNTANLKMLFYGPKKAI